MARDQQLLDTSRDYLYFITKFFEPINLSAPHIYHSALELSPLSSIVRENYCGNPFQGLKPRVVYGLPSSWDQPVTIHGHHRSYTWSLCGQSIAVMGETSVDIRDSLTLEKSSSLQLAGPDMPNRIKNLLAYSPDGHSLADYDHFSRKITIWDVQTGGEVESIVDGAASHPPSSSVWSLDGTMIGVVYPAGKKTWDVHTYYIASGGRVSICKIHSASRPFLWSQNGPLQVMTILCEEGNRAIVKIFRVGPAMLDNLIESFSINLGVGKVNGEISFSPATYRICITGGFLVVLDLQNSRSLLQEVQDFDSGCLSPDGSFLVASEQDGKISVWKYTSNQVYTLWRKLPYWGGHFHNPEYQFSPASSSILVSSETYLEVQQLEGLATDTPAGEVLHHEAFSTDGTYVVTASREGQAITITNLNNNSSQIIDIWFSLDALVITGNILLVHGADMIVAWRLTVDGTVDGVLGVRRANCSDSLWIKPLQEGGYPMFNIEGQTGVIFTCDSDDPMYYNIETGEKLEVIPANALPVDSGMPFSEEVYAIFERGPTFSFYDFDDCDNDTVPYYKEGWVKYPEGEYSHQFWLPVHWRPIWNELPSPEEWSEGYWLDDVMTLRLRTSFGLAIIKF